MRSHGVRSTYTLGGCRCDDCKAAHNTYNRRYFAKRRATVNAVEKIRWLFETYPDGDPVELLRQIRVLVAPEEQP